MNITVAIFCGIGFAMFVLPISYFHEIGHKVICEAHGGESRIGPPTNTGINAICIGSEVDLLLMRFFGGFFGIIGGMIPLAFYKWYKHNPHYLGILAATLGVSVAELPKAVLEPLNYDFYASDLGGQIFLIVNVVAIAGFFILFGREKAVPLTWGNA
ncbi:MAG: hypothetical protein HRF40_05370 [Nitrososphaera sp.]